MSDVEAAWTPTPTALARTRAALAAIDRAHIAWPQCRLCKQRVARLDAFGLCSKTSASHLRIRELGRRS